MDLLGTDPATIDASDVDFVENRQYSGAGSHQEGGRPQGKGSPRGGREDPPSRPPTSTMSPACLHPFGGESPGRRSVEVPVDPGLAPPPQGVSPDISPQGSPPDRPLRVSPIGADEPLLLLGCHGRTVSHRLTQPEVGLRAGLPLPSDSSPQEGYQEAGKVEGDVSPRHPLLGHPDVVCVSSALCGGRSPSSLQRRPHHRLDDRGASSWKGSS
jgi:hypothetical protein